MSAFRVTVVIPNYNGEKFLPECMASLKAQTLAHEVIVVDNASKDGSVEWLKNHCPEARLIENGENLGFAPAVDQGIEEAETEYCVLLNNDTKADPAFLEELVKVMDRYENAFSASAKMLQARDPLLIDDAGDALTQMGLPAQVGHGQKKSRYRRARRIFSSCGGAAIYRTAWVKELGGFDERFFAYCEDVDLGFRALRKGWENRFCPNALVLHFGSATSDSISNGTSAFRVRLSARNRAVMLQKNLSPRLKRWNKAFLAVGEKRERRSAEVLGVTDAQAQGAAQAKEWLKSIPKGEPLPLKTDLSIQLLMVRDTVPYLLLAVRRRIGKMVYRVFPSVWDGPNGRNNRKK